MSFTLRQLRYFVASAETGKMSTAAAQCGVSQSAVTIALRDLEYRFGSQLFSRHQSGVDLTDEGHAFLLKARDILAAVSDAMRSASAPSAAIAGPLTIGVTYTVMGYFLSHYVMRFRRRFAAVDLKIVQFERTELEAAIEDQRIDLAVMLISNVTQRRGISTQILQASPRRLWLAPGHDLLRRKTVALADLAERTYSMLTVDEAEDTTRRYWSRLGLTPNVVLHTSSVEAVRSFVAGGMGITILSDIVYRPWSLESERIELRNLDDPVPSMDIGIAWHPEIPWTPAVREFVHLLETPVGKAFKHEKI